MNEIAIEADISKSLLFFYFKNKQEFYIFLMKKAEELTMQYVRASGSHNEPAIFEMMYKSLQAKAEMMKDYPDMSSFALKAYYEEDEDVRDEIRKIVEPYTKLSTNKNLPPLNPDDYKEGLDLTLMYQNMYLASEGHLFQMQHSGQIDVDKLLKDFRKLIDFWKQFYLR